VIQVNSPSGVPLPNVFVDLWQANSLGVYDFQHYSLRGTARTDAHGRLEVLTIPPGRYGPESHLRAGHFHFRLTAPESNIEQYNPMATQVYLCQANESKWMMSDLFVFYLVYALFLALRTYPF
jgi:protocatechuate 3,4-dioxygenase beta subunit